MQVLAIFGPTAVGKTGVAVAVGEHLRRRGEDPVAVSCDAIQVYRGLELLSAAASEEEQVRLEHRLLSFVPLDEEFSAGRFAELAHAEINGLLAEGRRPIVVGGTGLYLRAALADLDLRPRVPAEIREQVEQEIEERGPQAVHAELDPDVAATVHPNDRKRIARSMELQRAGIDPPRPHRKGGRLWTAELRHPTLVVGLAVDGERLSERIDARVDAMVRAGAIEEVKAAQRAGASRTARAAIGFEELLAGDVEAVKRAQGAYARRQITWMRRMEGIELIDRGQLSDAEVAAQVIALLERRR